MKQEMQKRIREKRKRKRRIVVANAKKKISLISGYCPPRCLGCLLPAACAWLSRLPQSFAFVAITFCGYALFAVVTVEMPVKYDKLRLYK